MEKRQYHSRAYHQYFEGYAETEIITESGRRKIERVYVGNYFRLLASERRWVMSKVLYAILYAVSVFCLIFAGLQNLQMNYLNGNRYTLIPQMISFVTLFLFLIPLFYHVTAGRNMKISVFRESTEKLKRAAMVCGICLSGTALFSIIWLFIHGQYGQIVAWKCIAGNVISACAMWAVYFLENKAEYEQLPSETARPRLSSVIRY